MTPREVADKLLASLPEFYLEAEARTGSCYLRCKDPRVGSIRVANHPGRFSYRYQVHIDIGAVENRGRRVKRYGFQELDLLVSDVRREWHRRMFKGLDRMKEAERLAAWEQWRNSQRSSGPNLNSSTRSRRRGSSCS